MVYWKADKMVVLRAVAKVDWRVEMMVVLWGG
jgi:hypothetical protein